MKIKCKCNKVVTQIEKYLSKVNQPMTQTRYLVQILHKWLFSVLGLIQSLTDTPATIAVLFFLTTLCFLSADICQ